MKEGEREQKMERIRREESETEEGADRRGRREEESGRPVGSQGSNLTVSSFQKSQPDMLKLKHITPYSHAHTHRHTDTHTQTHTHMHTHTHSLSLSPKDQTFTQEIKR